MLLNTVVKKHPKARADRAEKAKANTALALERVVFIVSAVISTNAADGIHSHDVGQQEAQARSFHILSGW